MNKDNGFFEAFFFYFLTLTIILNLCACSTQKNTAASNANYRLAVATTTSSNVNRNAIKSYNSQSTVVPKGQGQMITINNSSGKKNVIGEAAVNNANKKAVQNPSSNRYTNSTMTFDYIDGALYQIYTAPLRITDIQFQEGEVISSVGAGDTLRWQVSRTFSGGVSMARVEHLLIKPVEEGLVNSLVITTDKRTYHLVLHSTPNTYMASVVWHYADDDANMIEKFNDSKTAGGGYFNAGVDVAHLNFHYKIKLIKGYFKPDWYPSMVFNDGQKTYIMLSPKMQEAPTLFVGNDIKSTQIVNYRVQGNYYIIDGLFGNMQLRSGQDNSTIVQINYAG